MGEPLHEGLATLLAKLEALQAAQAAWAGRFAALGQAQARLAQARARQGELLVALVASRERLAATAARLAQAEAASAERLVGLGGREALGLGPAPTPPPLAFPSQPKGAQAA